MPKNERLRNQRILHNWRQQDVADQLGATIISIQRWERGTQQPSAYYRLKLCVLFGLSGEELGLVGADVLPENSEETYQESRGADEEQENVSAPETFRLWTIPYTRNPHFTGRDHLLRQLEQQFAPLPDNQEAIIPRSALMQSQAVKGLGGIGKTQIALEYAYRAHEQERYTHSLWITADSEETIRASFVSLASLLPAGVVPLETDQHKLATECIRWLEQCEQPWLLIMDNADDLALVQGYLPLRGNGRILFTTRASAVGALANSLEVDSMGVIEGTQLLLRRAQRFAYASDSEIDEAANLVVALALFPLALDQAGAYIEETGCSVGEYLQLYERHSHHLLARRGQQIAGYPHSVATTWSLSFQQVEQTNPAAAELLQLCAFLAPDHIPEELLTQGAPYWPERLQQAVADPFRFNEMLGTLLSFSLIKRLAGDRLLSIHRLVQLTQMEQLSAEDQCQWTERLVRVVHSIFPQDPSNDTAVWSICQRYLEQAQACDMLIRQYQLLLPEAAELLNRVGTYLRERGVYTSAEQIYRRAIWICERWGEPESVLMMYPLANLATLCLLLVRHAEAEPLFVRAIQIWERQGLLEPVPMAMALTGLALLYFLQGRYEECGVHYQRALQLWKQQPDPGVAWATFGLALLYGKQGKYKEAEALFLQALHTKDEQEEVYHPLKAYTLQELGNLYIKQGKYTEAEATLLRALHLREEYLGTEHPDVIPMHNSLGILAYKQEQYEQAESRLLMTLHLCEQFMGSEHPDNAHTLTALGNLYTHQERYKEAQTVLLRALSLREQHLGSEHPYIADVLHGLANLYAKQKRDAEAESYFQQALQIFENRVGPDSLEVADILQDFADLRYAQGQHVVAVALYQRAITICEQALGADLVLTRKARERLHAVTLTVEESRKMV